MRLISNLWKKILKSFQRMTTRCFHCEIFSILQNESNESWKIHMSKLSTAHRQKLLWKNAFDIVVLQTGAKDSFFRGTTRADCVSFPETVKFNLLYFFEDKNQLLFSDWNLISRNWKELLK